MNDWQCFDVTMDGGVAHVRMNHPERHNSMVAAFWSELPRLVRALDEAKLVVEKLELNQPSLDDVFADATGYRLEGADNAPQAG